MRGQIGKIDFSIELRVTQQNWRIRRKNIQQLQKYLFSYFWQQELCQQAKAADLLTIVLAYLQKSVLTLCERKRAGRLVY